MTTEKSFEERRREKLAKAEAEQGMAQQLRRARCPVCQKPLLWHPEPGQPGTGTVSCKLDQAEVMELATAKPAVEGAPDPRAGLLQVQPIPATGYVGRRQGNLIGGMGTDADVIAELRDAGVQAEKIVDVHRSCWHWGCKRPAVVKIVNPEAGRSMGTVYGAPPPPRPSHVDSCRECADEAVRSRGR